MKIFRKMTPSDIEKIVKEEEKIFGHSLGVKMYLKDFKYNKYSLYFVLEIDNEFVGFICFWLNGDKAQIINFFIINEFRKKGLGEFLLNKSFEKVLEENVSTLTLEVNENNLSAKNLYEKVGFKLIDVRKKYYNRIDDALVLLKEL